MLALAAVGPQPRARETTPPQAPASWAAPKGFREPAGRCPSPTGGAL